MSSFDPSKLGQRSGGGQANKGPRAERVFMVVEKYELPGDNFHFAVGHKVGNPDERVRVRLNTVAERCRDVPGANAEKVTSWYESGENVREPLAGKAKSCIKFLSFDDARLIGKDDAGVAEYRAHWSKTMSTDPGAEVLAGTAHVKLKDADTYGGHRISARAYVEFIRGKEALSGENADRVLMAAFAIKDDQGRARDPLAIVRAVYDEKVVATARVYPSNKVAKVFDQVRGEHKEVNQKADAEVTIRDLLSAQPGFSDKELDKARALIAGVMGLDQPKFNSTDERIVGEVTNLYYGAKSGALQVEVLAAEKIDFGPDSRKTYLNDKNQPQLAVYTVKSKEGERQREAPGYTDTVIACHRHDDGELYAVFASPAVMYPKMQTLADLDLGDKTLAAENKVGVDAGKPVEADEPTGDEDFAP